MTTAQATDPGARAAQIGALHAQYCQATGQRVALNMYRERCWLDWLTWRKPEFGAADLGLVCRYLRRQIIERERNAGALKFSNLVAQPDRFEEDLALALQWARPKTAPPPRKIRTATPDGRATERQVPGTGEADMSRPVKTVLESEAFKEFVALKKTL